jgi:hypothetical protein
MNPPQKALLTAWEALGPERVTRGLQASGHTWNNCFRALATHGEPGVLARQLERRWRREHYVDTLLGVRVQVVNEVVRAWDHDEGAFRALAAAWRQLCVARLGTWARRQRPVSTPQRIPFRGRTP